MKIELDFNVPAAEHAGNPRPRGLTSSSRLKQLSCASLSVFSALNIILMLSNSLQGDINILSIYTCTHCAHVYVMGNVVLYH